MSQAIDPDAVAGQLTLEDQRDALNPFDGCPWIEFADEVTYGYMVHPKERGTWRPLGPQHKRWLEQYASGKSFALLAHRYGLKTTIVLIYIIARLEYDPGFTALWITNTEGQAQKKADEEFNKLVDRNPWLVNLQERNRDRDTIKTKHFTNGSTFNAAWLFGGLEGDRADLIVFDDLIKEEGDGDTEKIWNWASGAAMPIGKENSQEVFIGTRKRPDDIYEHIRAETDFDLVEYPLILDVWDQEFGDDTDWQTRRPDPDLYEEIPNPLSDGADTVQVLWPQARGADFIREKRGKVGRHMFYRAYCLVIRGASGNLIDEVDVNRLVDDDGCSIRGQSPPREYTPSAGEAVVVAHDPAQSPTGDNAAFVAFRVGRDGRRRLLDAHAETGMSPSAIKGKLADLDARYDPAVVVIESNGMQQYVANDAIEFSAQLRGKVTGIPTTGKKHSWENGIPRLRTLVENGGIQFYRGHGPTEDFVHAALSLSLKNGRLEGHTPDLIAAWYMAEQGIRRLEQIGALEEPDEDEESDRDTGVSGI